MKKAFALLLALLLLAGCACGEDAGFSLRGGVTWGMSADEVLAIEGNPPYDAERENGLDAILIEDAVHEGAACSLKYLFFEDSLCMIEVEYDTEAASVTFEALTEALSERYGEATALNAALFSEYAPAEGDEANRFYGWVLDSETLVCLSEDRAEHTIEIMMSDLSE